MKIGLAFVLLIFANVCNAAGPLEQMLQNPEIMEELQDRRAVYEQRKVKSAAVKIMSQQEDEPDPEPEKEPCGVEEHITDYNWTLARVRNADTNRKYCHLETNHGMLTAHFFVEGESTSQWYPIGPVGSEYEWGCK